MVKDRWIRAAMSDDMLVVDLLVRIKQSQDSSFLKSSSPSMATPMIPLRWSLRLPRSRAVRCDVDSQRKKSDSARCSPTTPLSWSGGAFQSATANGFEESSHLRSKGNTTNESASTATTIADASRSKKKTFAELKDEESSLLKERTDMKKELATLRANFKEQRTKNMNLKRIKLDLNFDSVKSLDASYCRPETNQLQKSTVKEFSANLSTQITYDDSTQPSSSEASELGHGFRLPDLNMVPSEVDYASEMLCEMR